jgi:hypothetical protein
VHPLRGSCPTGLSPVGQLHFGYVPATTPPVASFISRGSEPLSVTWSRLVLSGAVDDQVAEAVVVRSRDHDEEMAISVMKSTGVTP